MKDNGEIGNATIVSILYGNAKGEAGEKALQIQ
jgi:hypothetical protein